MNKERLRVSRDVKAKPPLAAKKRARSGDVALQRTPPSAATPQTTKKTTQSPVTSDVVVPVTSSEVIQLSEEEYLRKIEQRTEMGHAAVAAKNSLMTDPVYRILHQAHRSDVVEVVRSKFGPAECERAAAYLQQDFSSFPVRRLRLQLNVNGDPQHLGRFLPFMTLHASTLRLVDLSRNQLTTDDVVRLCTVLNLRANPTLEMLDLSCNRGIGNGGATALMKCISTNPSIRVVALKHIGLDDVGAKMIAPYVQSRPVPSTVIRGATTEGATDETPEASAAASSWSAASDQHRASCNFFLNLNENCIGPVGLVAIRRNIPDYVSLTVLHQRPKRIVAATSAVPSHGDTNNA